MTVLDPDAPVRDPLPLLREWLTPALGDQPDLMQMATIDEDGHPDIRTLLVSSISSDGLHFHSNRDTRKVRQLENTPSATACVVWPERGRQVVVSGEVFETDPAEQAEAFQARSRYLQTLSWANTPENAVLPRAERERIWAQCEVEHPGAEPVSPHWWGGCLIPRRITFWQAGDGAASSRVEYRRQHPAADAEWAVTILPG